MTAGRIPARAAKSNTLNAKKGGALCGAPPTTVNMTGLQTGRNQAMFSISNDVCTVKRQCFYYARKEVIYGNY